MAAHPGQGTNVPVWILGSSLYGASLAAALGLPYAFASHFAPNDLDEAVRLYRSRFQPGPWGEAPRFMLAANLIAADTDEAARKLRTSQQISFYRLRSGTPGKLPPPVITQEYTTEYSTAALEIPADGVDVTGKRVVLVDDVLATGGTLVAARNLIERAGGSVAGYVVVLEVEGLGGREKLGDAPLVVLTEEHPDAA